MKKCHFCTKHPQIADSGRDLIGSPVVAGELRARFRICCSPRPVLSHPRKMRLVEAFLTKRDHTTSGLILFKGPRISGSASYAPPAKCAMISAAPYRFSISGNPFRRLRCYLKCDLLEGGFLLEETCPLRNMSAKGSQVFLRGTPV